MSRRAFGNHHVHRDSVRRISAGDQVDLLVASLGDFRDIIELKRPDMEVLAYDSHHRSYFLSADASKALGQCLRYLDVLHQQARRGLADHEEVVAYYPNVRIVIGRSVGWVRGQREALQDINGRVHGVAFLTYDHLLLQAERQLALLDPGWAEADRARASVVHGRAGNRGRKGRSGGGR